MFSLPFSKCYFVTFVILFHSVSQMDLAYITMVQADHIFVRTQQCNLDCIESFNQIKSFVDFM